MREIMFSRFMSDSEAQLKSEIANCKAKINTYNQRLLDLEKKLSYLKELKEKALYTDYIDKNFYTAFSDTTEE